MSKFKIQMDADPSGAKRGLDDLGDSLKGLGKSSDQLARETEKSANQTVGSYAKLRGELASNKKALEQLEVGSEVFKEQAGVVAELEDKLKAAKAEISAAVAAGQKFDNVAQAVAITDGSLDQLRKSLKQATGELDQLKPGTAEFEKQGKVVAKLTAEVNTAKQSVDRFTQAGTETAQVAKAVKLADGSVGKLSASLRKATTELDGLQPGTEEFDKQGKVVAKLTTELDEAKTAADAFKRAGDGAKNLSVQTAVASNSVEGITIRLKEANNQLKRADRGSDAYKKQAKEVEKLTKELDDANKEMKEFTGQRRGVDGVTGSLSRLEDELADNVRQLRNLKVGTAEFKKQKAAVDKLSASVDKAKKKFRGGVGSRVGESVRQFAGSVTGFAAVAGGLAATAKLVMSELEDLKRRDAESKVAVRTREQSIAKLVQNAGAELTDKIVERAEATAAVTGADADKLISISSSVASAGITDEKVVVDTAATALRSQGGDVGSGDAIAGAAVDLASTLKISIQEAFGALFQTAGTARPKDIAQMGKAAVKTTAALTGIGVEAERAQEQFAAFTLMTGDMTGERSASMADDLATGFRKLKQKGVPEQIEVGGKKVKVKIPKEILQQLQGENLKGISFEKVEQLARQSKEFEQVFESLLPDSQNRKFTQQVVGGSVTYDAKLSQAATAIDLGIAEQRATKQVADVEQRRPIGALAEQIDAILDRNLQDTTAALKATARETFTRVLERADNKGFDYVADWVSEGLADVREHTGQGVAGSRVAVLRDAVETGKVGGKDVETLNAAILVLERTQQLINISESGGLSPADVGRELATLRELLGRLFSDDAKAQVRAQNEAASLPSFQSRTEAVAAFRGEAPTSSRAEAVRAAPLGTSTTQAVKATAIPQANFSPQSHAVVVRAKEAPATTATQSVPPSQAGGSRDNELLLMESRKRTKLAEDRTKIAERQEQRAERQEQQMQQLISLNRPKVLSVKNVDSGPVERPPASSEVP